MVKYLTKIHKIKGKEHITGGTYKKMILVLLFYTLIMQKFSLKSTSSISIFPCISLLFLHINCKVLYLKISNKWLETHWNSSFGRFFNWLENCVSKFFRCVDMKALAGVVFALIKQQNNLMMKTLPNFCFQNAPLWNASLFWKVINFSLFSWLHFRSG